MASKNRGPRAIFSDTRAVQTVVARWQLQSDRSIYERIEKDRDEFFGAVADELLLNPRHARSGNGGGSGRTSGIGDYGNGGGGWGSQECEGDEPGSMADEITAVQRKSGYY